MNERLVAPSPEALAFRNEALELLRRHGGALPADHMLALAADLVGQIIAMQDQRTMTPERALAIVTANIEKGNQEVRAHLGATKGTA
jgi:hypothetical protein